MGCNWHIRSQRPLVLQNSTAHFKLSLSEGKGWKSHLVLTDGTEGEEGQVEHSNAADIAIEDESVVSQTIMEEMGEDHDILGGCMTEFEFI